MSSCTPEQIEEKKRLALARLKARQNVRQRENTTNNYTNQSLKTSYSPKSQYSYNSFNNSTNKNDLINGINHTSKTLFSYNEKGSLQSSPISSKSYTKPYDRSQHNKNTNFKSAPQSAASFFNVNNQVTGTMYLISENRFAVESSKFHQQLIDTFKTIPSRNYDSKTRLWDFSIDDYENLCKKLLLLRPNVVIGVLPNWVLNCIRKKTTVYSSIDLSPIDSELLNALMPFQKEGVCFGIEKNGRCLIADEMGLGKTFQALAIANYYKNDWPLLIATTSSMKNTWEEKIQNYLPSVPLMHIQYMQSGKDYINDAQILIVSHDLMSRCVDKLLERHFGVIVMDESHTLKNFKAKCTKAAISLAKQAKRVILLSGTPALSRPSELFTQISMIDHRFFPDFKEYSVRYCQGHMTQFGWNANGQSNLTELEILLNRRFMIRRTKDEVLDMLPNKTREVVKLSSELLEFSENDLKCLGLLQNDYTRKKSFEKHSALLTFFSETAKLKIKAVKTYISRILDSEIKFIVFAHHQIMLNSICELFEIKRIPYIKIDGKTTSDQRKYFVDKFQLQDKYRCAVLSITAANAGITLTAAQLVLFAELHWNPSILSQAESRAHRIGQENCVEVKYLLAEGTADDYMWQIIQNKQDVLNEAGLSKGSFSNTNITKQTYDASHIPGHKKKTIKSYFIDEKSDVDSRDTFDEIQTEVNKLNSINIGNISCGFDVSELEGLDSTNFEEDFFDDDDDSYANVNIDLFN